MSDDTIPTIPPAPATFPMTCQEAHEMGLIIGKMAPLNAEMDRLTQKVCARLGLAIGTRLNADPQRGVYTVG